MKKKITIGIILLLIVYLCVIGRTADEGVTTYSYNDVFVKKHIDKIGLDKKSIFQVYDDALDKLDDIEDDIENKSKSLWNSISEFSNEAQKKFDDIVDDFSDGKLEKKTDKNNKTQNDNKKKSSNEKGVEHDSSEVYIPSSILTYVSDLEVNDIPKYVGDEVIEINDNVPVFSEEDKNCEKPFEYYSDLDLLGRCGVAYANVCKELMPDEDRQSLSLVTPTGWNQNKYDFIEGEYLMNRMHLIAFCLAGEQANEKNLVSGTRQCNEEEGMLKYEIEVADYIDKHPDNHVLYRICPIFGKFDMFPSGIHMEAYSVEDKGKGVSFNVYCYNVQDGVYIDTLTGKNWAN